VVSDEVLRNFRSMLEAKLKVAKADLPVADPGRFVASIDSAATASISSYVASITQNLSGTSTPAAAAASPADAMAAWLKAKGTDTSSMSYAVVQTSESDPNWKIDTASESGGEKTYFLLHNVNNAWAVVNAGSSITAAQLKTAGAPSDLKAVP
jgi:hypothetical protein